MERIKLRGEKTSGDKYEWVIVSCGIDISRIVADTVYFTKVCRDYSLWRKTLTKSIKITKKGGKNVRV